MDFCIVVWNAVRKTESKKEKKWSKVKVTGQGQRGQITVRRGATAQEVERVTQFPASSG